MCCDTPMNKKDALLIDIDVSPVFGMEFLSVSETPQFTIPTLDSDRVSSIPGTPERKKRDAEITKKHESPTPSSRTKTDTVDGVVSPGTTLPSTRSPRTTNRKTLSEASSASSTANARAKATATPRSKKSPTRLFGSKYKKKKSFASPTESPASERPSARASASSNRSLARNASGIIHRSDPDEEEQAMFEQRLCEDPLGVAVRKISGSGKSQLRYVRCVPIDAGAGGSVVSTASKYSISGRLRKKTTGAGSYQNDTNDGSNQNLISSTLSQRSRALTWGNKNRVLIPLEMFTCVRKGKNTDRTRRNSCPSSRLLSIMTDDRNHSSLDIEAPTRLDRDKFARAFSRFLAVPLETEGVTSSQPRSKRNLKKNRIISGAHTAPDTLNNNYATNGINTHSKSPMSAASSNVTASLQTPKSQISSVSLSSTHVTQSVAANSGLLPTLSPTTVNTEQDRAFTFQPPPILTDNKLKTKNSHKPKNTPDLNLPSSSNPSPNNPPAISRTTPQTLPKSPPKSKHTKSRIDVSSNLSSVSSLTANFDQEIVEELHLALAELRAELESSRAEAARAVKVAEQAIQSAESCTSNDWNSTVTHKAAEAAAQAQKRSAEAMARQRLAEERLAGEKRSATFWRRQAEIAEEGAGVLQVKAAVAEVRRESMCEELVGEKRRLEKYVKNLKEDFGGSESLQREAIEQSMERNRSLEIQLEGTRRDLERKNEEAKVLQEVIQDGGNSHCNREVEKEKKRMFGRIGRKSKRDSSGGGMRSRSDSRDRSVASLLLSNEMSGRIIPVNAQGAFAEDKMGKLVAEAALMRNQFETLKKCTREELATLPHATNDWIHQISRALSCSQSEILTLRSKLSLESALRRKLHHEVQDLRSNVRVYCRPRPSRTHASNSSGIVSVPSHETLVVHREQVFSSEKSLSKSGPGSGPLSFEYDRVFDPSSSQTEVFQEIEELVLNALDGYIVCFLAYGQTSSGKSHTLLGDISLTNQKLSPGAGVHLQSVDRLFTVASCRRERFQDLFSITILEVHGDRLNDLVAGTPSALARGETQGRDVPKLSRRKRRNKEQEEQAPTVAVSQTDSNSQKNKLEIRTNYDGDTIVQGLISVAVSTTKQVCDLWKECLAQRSKTLKENGIGEAEHASKSHILITVNVVSTNISTGVGTVGKLTFVDLAGSDLIPKRGASSANGMKSYRPTPMDAVLSGVGNGHEWKFANKSLSTLMEVVNARCQFARTVPYRNSTLTHLLRDCLEGDAKVLLFACVSSDSEDLQETASALRFAQRMRRIQLSKATKHTVSLA